MTPEIQAVLKLQTLDARAAAFQKEIEALPKQVAEIEKKLESHTRKLEVDRAAWPPINANAKARKTTLRSTSRRSRNFEIRCCKPRPTSSIAHFKTKLHTARPRFAKPRTEFSI